MIRGRRRGGRRRGDRQALALQQAGITGLLLGLSSPLEHDARFARRIITFLI